jgi:hypothetical protein
VRQRLTDLARKQGEDFQLVLTRYVIERLLYRLSRSGFTDEELDFIINYDIKYRMRQDGGDAEDSA